MRCLQAMTLAEKIGQMCQLNASEGYAPDYLAGGSAVEGRVGSVLNVVDVSMLSTNCSALRLRKVAARDPAVGRARRHSRLQDGHAHTARAGGILESCGYREGGRTRFSGSGGGDDVAVNWTFAPMIDISRDARWGRIAESLGECVLLSSELGCGDGGRVPRRRSWQRGRGYRSLRESTSRATGLWKAAGTTRPPISRKQNSATSTCGRSRRPWMPACRR